MEEKEKKWRLTKTHLSRRGGSGDPLMDQCQADYAADFVVVVAHLFRHDGTENGAAGRAIIFLVNREKASKHRGRSKLL